MVDGSGQPEGIRLVNDDNYYTASNALALLNAI